MRETGYCSRQRPEAQAGKVRFVGVIDCPGECLASHAGVVIAIFVMKIKPLLE